MSDRPVRALLSVVLATALAAGACSAPAPSDIAADSPDPSRSTPAAQAPPTAADPTLAAPDPARSADALPTDPPVESPAPTTPSINTAPVAVLVIGDERYPGEVGGFTFGRYTQSAPWLPASALETVAVAPGAAVRVELDERAAIAEWSARLATAEDVTANAVSGLASGRGQAAAFAAPASGDWVLSLSITYAGGLGDGAYFWHVVVEP
jgi:hypothetical protein